MKIQKVNDIWLKASVVGSLWASVEIIIGSFFHNLRVPLAGTILAMISVALMVAFHQHWKERGLFWRAGIICALMKSISPSAILLGPMTGILAEALLMEMFTRMLGGNLLGYLVGGAAALASTIAHKIINLLVIYGFDIVTVLVNLYEFAVRQIGYPKLQPELALWILFGLYALLGMGSASVGFIVGRRSFHHQTDSGHEDQDGATDQQDFFQLKADQYFSVKLLFFHMFAIVVCLVIISKYSLWVGALFILAYVLFSVFQYQQSLKHLKRPIFWVQVLLLTFLATIFFNGFQKGNIFDAQGLMAGLQMNIRAVLILVGFSSISVELRNPVIKAVLMKRGFSQLYLSLGLAFSALPWIIKNFPKPRVMLKNPGTSIMRALGNADHLLALFTHKTLKPRVIIITGERHEGKTTFALELLDDLLARGIKPGGFLAPGKFENNRRSSFDILDVKTGNRKLLCSIHLSKGEQIGPFKFDPDGQNFGFELLSGKQIKNTDIVFIDEIGPLEMKGKGWAVAIDKLVSESALTMVWVVRRNLVSNIVKKWDLLDVEVCDINTVDVGQVSKLLLKG